MIEITVTGHITARKECKNDLEALLFLQEIKDQHDTVLRPLMPDRPGLYYYAPKTEVSKSHTESIQYRLTARQISKAYPLKVEIRTMDDWEDLL